MTNFINHAHQRKHVCLASIAACLVICAAPPVVAEEGKPDTDLPPPTNKSTQFEVEYYVIMPTPLLPGARNRGAAQQAPQPIAYSDPTIIPFNGWSFFDAEGNEQPWRRRGEINKDKYSFSGGQFRSHLDKARLDIYWRQPIDADAEPQRARISSERHANVFNGLLIFDRISTLSKQHHYYRGQFPFEGIEAVTDTLPVEIKFTHGAWKTVAKATPSSKLPVGNDHVKIEYIGKPRVGHATPRAVTERPDDYTFEIFYSRNIPKDHWLYRIQYFDKQGKKRSGNDMSSRTDDGIYLWPKIALDEVDRFEIQRRPLAYDKLEPLNLIGAIGVWKEDFVQKRIELSPEHYFSEPVSVDVQPLSPGATCLVDLDHARVISMPDPAPTGDNLLKLYEKEGIDMVIRTDRSRLTANTIGCTFFVLADQFWAAGPQACTEKISGRRNPATQLDMRDKRLTLITTTDGGMVLLRTTRADFDKQNNTGSATIEIRQLKGP